MASLEQKTTLEPLISITPVAVIATTNGAIIDTLGARAVTIAIISGAIAGSGLFVASLQAGDAANLSDAVAVTSADLIGSFSASIADTAVETVGYVGGKRYVRVVVTKTSGTSVVAGGVVILGKQEIEPV